MQSMTFDDVNTRIEQPMEDDIHRGMKGKKGEGKKKEKKKRHENQLILHVLQY